MNINQENNIEKKESDNVAESIATIDNSQNTKLDENKNIGDTLQQKQGFFYKLKQTKFCQFWATIWQKFKKRFPNLSQFLVFFMLSNGVTILQMIMLIVFKEIFNKTSLVNINFQIGRVGKNFDGTPYYMFNYQAGAISKDGYGGGLAYFLAVQIAMAIAQVINFFAQRNITFKSKGNPWFAAMWYLLAYVAITVIAAALQGLYKAPIYSLFMTTFHWGKFGEACADVITMIINCAISFWVFFPIFKLIFKDKKGKKDKTPTALNA